MNYDHVKVRTLRLLLALVAFAGAPARANHNPDVIGWCSMRVAYQESGFSCGPLYNCKRLNGVASIQCPGAAQERFVFSAEGYSEGEGLADDSRFHRRVDGIVGEVLVGVPASLRLHGLIGAFRQDGSIGNAEGGSAATRWVSEKGESLFFPVGWMYPSLSRDGRIAMDELRLVFSGTGELAP